MAGPDYGALGATFKCVRALQAASLITVIGMTANFISETVSANQTPPSVLIGTISVTCIAVIYCVITFILFLDDILPFLLNTVADSLLLIALIVVAVTVGKPLSYLDCQIINTGDNVSSAYEFTTALGGSLNENGGLLDFNDWIGATKTNCLEMKAIWGLSIALCVLFSFSSICSVVLWRRKPVLASSKDVEG